MYAIVDVEPHDPSKAATLRDAITEARRNGVCLLMSNPCFEYWLLCHVADKQGVCRSFADPDAVERELRKHGYPKQDLLDHPGRFDALLSSAAMAVQHAREVHQAHHKGASVETVSGCTQVYELVSRLV